MSVKTTYILVVIAFYSSLLVGLNDEKAALLIHGHGVELAFKQYDVSSDHAMIDKYYFAYKESTPSMTIIARSAIAIWAVTLFFSWYVVARKPFVPPYKLHIVTLVTSALAIVIFVLLPLLLFGSGPPPSPL